MNVYLEVNGKPVPAKELFWGNFAPCGCMSGVMTVDLGDEVRVTAEQAAASFYENKVERKRSEEEGFTFRLMTRDEYKATDLGCKHIPKWGVERPEPPEGWQWGTNDRHFGRRTHIKHMVPEGCLVEPGEKWPPEYVLSLCQTRPSSAWWQKVDQFFDGVSCKKCDAVALAQGVLDRTEAGA